MRDPGSWPGQCLVKCACGATVEPGSVAECVGAEIDQGEVLESIACSACPDCCDGLDSYIFLVVVE